MELCSIDLQIKLPLIAVFVKDQKRGAKCCANAKTQCTVQVGGRAEAEIKLSAKYRRLYTKARRGGGGPRLSSIGKQVGLEVSRCS